MTPGKPFVELTDEEFGRFRALIYRVAGIRIPPTKRVMVSNRIRRRLRATGIAGFSQYYAHLTSAAGAGEMPRFLDEITTNETYFYRDPHHYQWLADTFLPEIAQRARLGRHPRRLRIWSAACSTGEEPYSIALKLAANRPLFPGWSLTVLGTDLSEAALESARAASYDAKAMRLVPLDERRARFDHDPAAGRWALKPEVRALVTWKAHNLITPLREDPFDCIFTKNVLIYFDEESKRVVVGRLIEKLAEGGYLVVGPTEGIHKMLDPLARQRTWLYQRPGRPAADHRRAADAP